MPKNIVAGICKESNGKVCFKKFLQYRGCFRVRQDVPTAGQGSCNDVRLDERDNQAPNACAA